MGLRGMRGGEKSAVDGVERGGKFDSGFAVRFCGESDGRFARMRRFLPAKSIDLGG